MSLANNLGIYYWLDGAVMFSGKEFDSAASVLYDRTATLCHSIHFRIFMQDPILIFCMQGSTSEELLILSVWCSMSDFQKFMAYLKM